MRICISGEEFLHIGDRSNQDNLVIRTDLNQREDIKIVHKKIWDSLINTEEVLKSSENGYMMVAQL